MGSVLDHARDAIDVDLLSIGLFDRWIVFLDEIALAKANGQRRLACCFTTRRGDISR